MSDFARELYEAAPPILDMEVIHGAPEATPTQVPVPGTTVQVPPGLGPRPAPARVGVLMLDSDPPRGREAVSAEVELERDRPLRALSFTLPLPTPSDTPIRPGQLVEFSPAVTAPQRISGAVPAYPPAAHERPGYAVSRSRCASPSSTCSGGRDLR